MLINRIKDYGIAVFITKLLASMKSFRLITALIIGTFLFPLAAWGQTAQGSLTGSIKDPQNLPLAGGSVTIRNIHTNQRFSAVTNESGIFEIPSLPPGQYSVTVESQGFKKAQVEPVIVETARPAHIDLKLEVGQISGEVVIKSSDAQADVNVVSPEINTILSRQELSDLPMIRNPFLIVNSLAGINAPSAVGTRGTSTNITQDGINVADHFNRFAFGVNTAIITDNTAEISISTNTIGSTGGFGVAQIRVVTPSGTNTPRGSVYLFHQNSAINANTFFNNRSGIGKSPFHVNSIGVTFGGPIYLPRLYNGKDRTFFFLSIDLRRQPSTIVGNPLVLSQAARQGKFRYVGSDNVEREVDLLRIGNIPNLNPVTGQLINKTPLPNNFDVGDGFNIGGFRFSTASRTDTDRHTLKLTHLLSQTQQLEVSYNHNTVFSGPFSVTLPGLPAGDQFTRRQMGVVALRSTLSNTVVNTARFGFKIEPFSRKFGRAESFPFRITFQGIANPESLSSGFFRDSPSKEVNDQLMWVRGNHSMNCGFEIRWVRGRDINETGVIPTVNLGATALNPSGIDASELPSSTPAIRTRAEQIYANLIGLLSSASQTFNVIAPGSGFVPGAPFERHIKQNFAALYAQDRWKATPRLAVSLGLRWEYHGVPQFTRGAALLPVGGADGVWGASGASNLFSPGRFTGQPTTLDFGGVEGAPHLYRKDKNNFAPSIGFAWDVTGNGRTAIRGGYSISYTPETLTLYTNVADTNRGLQVTSSNTQLTGVLTASGAPITVPQFQLPISQSALFALSNSTSVAAFNPNYRTPYIQQWSIGIERLLFADFVVEARYVANHGLKLTRGIDLNEVNIFESGFLEDFRRALSNLATNRASGVASFANLGQPGQAPLPLLDLIFGGANTAFHRNSTFIGFLDSNQAGSFANSIRLMPRNFPGMSRLPANIFVVNPDANQALLLDNGSFSTYNSLQLELRRRFSRGFFLSSNYTFSKALTDFEGSPVTEISPLVTIRHPQVDKRRASFDIRHVFNLNGIYELPFGSGQRFLAGAPRPIRQVIDRWRVSTIVRMTAGGVVGIISGMGTFNSQGGRNTVNLSPDLSVDQIQKYIGIFKTPFGVMMIDLNAPFVKITVNPGGELVRAEADLTRLQNPRAGQLGALALNAFKTPFAWNADLALIKQMRFWESVNMELRADFFNLFNHPSFSVPSSLNINSTQFGVITSAGARSIQVSARINF